MEKPNQKPGHSLSLISVTSNFCRHPGEYGARVMITRQPDNSFSCICGRSDLCPHQDQAVSDAIKYATLVNRSIRQK